MKQNWDHWEARLRALAKDGMVNAEQYDQERYAEVLAIADQIAHYHPPAATKALISLKPIAPVTPKVDVRGIVFRDDAVLLVRELMDGGRWTLPGGWVDIDQSPSEAVEREVLEETGYRVKAARLILLVDKRSPRHQHPPDLNHIYKLFFLCDLLDDQPVQPQQASAKNLETANAAFFHEAQIAALDLSLGRVTAAQLARCFAHFRTPSLPPEFD